MHSHGIHSHHTTAAGNKAALRTVAWITGIYFLVELGIGIHTGSVAVLSDAFHTFSAVAGVLLALFAGRMAARPADHLRTFGSFRIEIVGALFNGLFLLVMALIVLWMGFERLFHPVELPTTPMFIAAIGGLVTEFISMRLLYGAQKDNLNIKGAFWHVVQTFVGSLIVIIVAIVVRLTGFVAIDPILGMLFGVTLFFASWSILRESVDILLEGVPKGVDIRQVQEALEKIPGVANVHHIHAWSLTSGKNIFSAHLRTDDASRIQEIQSEAQQLLRERFGFYFSTIQVETDCGDPDPASDIDITNGAGGTK